MIFQIGKNYELQWHGLTEKSGTIRPKYTSVTKLGNGDLFHYGWNIWNHFKPVKKNKQEDIAYFLKTLFAQPLKKVEVATIRKKLTFSEGKYKIKIENALRLQQGVYCWQKQSANNNEVI